MQLPAVSVGIPRLLATDTQRLETFWPIQKRTEVLSLKKDQLNITDILRGGAGPGWASCIGGATNSHRQHLQLR
ncbi:hypothetical protein PUN28_011636 [Cardiocondyla obscurior]|uniref:Uncharacterized protein n=1 Tax=Cardiocondyla obscurior TaxID=286306 RepID=A0AAW2FHJ7_9HYME